METYKKIKLGDICEILNGFAFKSEEYVDEGIRIIRITNVQKGFIVDFDPKFYSFETKNQYSHYLLNEEDLLISLTGNVGRVGLISADFLPAFLNQRVGCIRPLNDTIINKKYLFYYLNNNNFERACINSSKGIAQKNMSTKWLKEYYILLPELGQQEKIVTILDKISNLISLRKQQLEKLDLLVKSRFIEMFGEPEFNKYNWNKDLMGNFITTLTDFSANGSYSLLDSNVIMYDTPNYALMVRTIDLEKNDFVNEVKYIDKQAYELLSKSKIFGNEIIMNKIGSAGKVYLMPYLNRPVSLGRNAFLIRYNKNINPVFIYFLLISKYGIKEIQQYVRGAVTKTITKEAVRAIKIIAPPIELQNKFADFVQKLEKQNSVIQHGLDKLEFLKKALMQKYFC